MTTTPLQEPDTIHPSLECDLVMKGGITSGIVYPPAVFELARQYRFRAIGGASAGAIAAAITAAAEYSRQNRQKTGVAAGGFMQLLQESTEITEVDASGESGLSRLFRPIRRTAPLLNVANFALKGIKANKNFVGKGIQRFIAALIRYMPLWFCGGMAVFAALVWALAWLPSGSLNRTGDLWTALWGLLVLGVLLAGGILGGVAGLVIILLREVGSNGFGICSGMSDDTNNSKGYLTQWLCDVTQRIAGLPTGKGAKPLTFGDLEAMGITLRMMTTNVSQGQPYALPFDQNVWVFKKSEWRKLFPDYVYDHLETTGRSGNTITFDEKADYCFLPSAADMPIAVAARMSLSFPVLISAIPLYTISGEGYSAGKKAKKEGNPFNIEKFLQKNWFSDGGMSSNFPIHFFDAWLPGRPTFGINLGSLPFEKGDTAIATDQMAQAEALAPKGISPESSGPESKTVSIPPDSVVLPRANDFPARPWQSINTLLGFGSALIFTMKDYKDNLQAVMPSYRERIVEVRLSHKEGGLNLNMPQETLDEVKEKGKQAGKMLVNRYVDGPGWPHHQWTRYLVLMGQLERELLNLKFKLSSGTVDIDKLVEAERASSGPDAFPYRRSDAVWVKEANEIMERLEELLAKMPETSEVYTADCPKPEGSLRITPKG
jgi:predicted acylesterase/phospholipase RssA